MLAQAAARRRQVVLGGVSVGGFLLAGAVVLVWWLHKQSVENEARAEIAHAQSVLQGEIAAWKLDDADQAARAVRRLEASKIQWEHWPAADQFAQILTKAQATVATASTARVVQQAVLELEQKAAAQPREPAAWAAMHDRANALAAEVKAADKDTQQRLHTCVDRIDEGHLASLRNAVAAGGADGPTVRGWLVTAEELALARVAAAERAHDAAGRKRWDDDFLALAKQEDALAAAAYDPAAIAAVSWRDLLPGTQTADWLHSATTGLHHEVKDGVLTIDAADAGAKSGGVIVLKGHTWRHCQIECEVTLLSGSTTLLLRADKRATPKMSAAVRLANAENKDALVVPRGVPTMVGMLLVGDRLVATAGGRSAEVQVPAHARTGGLAIVIEPGTTVQVGSLRIKELP